MSPIDTSRPHPARRYDYWLGGKDNFQADRQSGAAVEKRFPTVRIAVQENRRFLRRAVTYLARQAGIRQFLDIGTGIPTRPNVHEIAQEIAPDSRIVYVDNDAVVLSHARALLRSSPEGATAYVQADLREPAAILRDRQVSSTLDLSQPVGLLLIAVLHFIPGREAYDAVDTLLGAMAPGSYLAISHSTYDGMPDELADQLNTELGARDGEFAARSKPEFGRFFDGLELVPPGVTSIASWRAENEPQPRPSEHEVAVYGAVGCLKRDGSARRARPRAVSKTKRHERKQPPRASTGDSPTSPRPDPHRNEVPESTLQLPHARSEPAVVVVPRWTGREAAALRRARRLSIRGYAEHLGFHFSSIAHWERRGEQARLRNETKEILDADLATAPDDVKRLFGVLLLEQAGGSH